MSKVPYPPSVALTAYFDSSFVVDANKVYIGSCPYKRRLYTYISDIVAYRFDMLYSKGVKHT